MRPYSALNPLQGIPVPPDSVNTILLTGGSTGQAMDWPGAPANAGAGFIGIARFTFCSTAGAVLTGLVNLISTHMVGPPSSGSSVTTGTTEGSTGNILPVTGSREFQVPAFSTGFSVGGFTSGWCMVEVWKK